MSESWLSAEKKEFDRLQAMDAALDEDQIAADIDKILSQKRNKSVGDTKQQKSEVVAASARQISDDLDGEDAHFSDDNNVSKEYSSREYGGNNAQSNQLASPEIERAPETADRYTKAKVSFMTKQLSDATEIRTRLEEQVRDLQRQLKTSREDNSSLKKRVQQLETEMRKANITKRGFELPGSDSIEVLQQEVSVLKKDVATYERMTKQSEENNKNKEGQLKRALDTIARLKSQLQEAQQQLQNTAAGEVARTEALENRVKLLEKQRSELVDGFRKQMKLIDVLKRQKVHLEAARLLAFTEEEFMKALEWRV